MSSEPGPDEVYCIECGEIIREKAEICPECGVRQPTAPGGHHSGGGGVQRGQQSGAPAATQGGQPAGSRPAQGGQPAGSRPAQGGQPARGGRGRPAGDPNASEAFKLMLAYYQEYPIRGLIHALVALFTAGGWALWFVFFWFGTFVGWKDVEGMRDIRYS
ncbi:hypothetical protein GCM10008995_06430 [Halobellus salinus]|uniref:Zinc ribbon domain-containing protein n=2 Tax=Halobellus salinus TaxID=931585 RepID=A0A830EMT2_9EURY|nr:zinc ribbon domain-containing protein [Halobellus salinus]GGI99217.1 hypothetical protein GCM10008995_06430 [Halobellus salinus]